MPALRRPCLTCGVPVPGASYCAEHQPVRQRGKQAYNWRWRRMSKAVREANPYCSRCGSTEDLTVDHVNPLGAGGPLLPPTPEDLRVLCRQCHGTRGSWDTATRPARRGRGGRNLDDQIGPQSGPQSPSRKR